MTESPLPTQPPNSDADRLRQLAAADAEASAAQHRVTEAAQQLLADGLPLAAVCDALGINHQEWYRRVDALSAWRQRHRSAAG